jgi:hypothetical protein
MIDEAESLNVLKGTYGTTDCLFFIFARHNLNKFLTSKNLHNSTWAINNISLKLKMYLNLL